jgi:hypothetical protein
MLIAAVLLLVCVGPLASSVARAPRIAMAAAQTRRRP